MSINFLHPALQSTLECSTVATEGYEISNLISPNETALQKGFLAERFISGPVVITSKFLCPVTIKYIIIWSKVSNQRSLGFELSSLKYIDEKQTASDFQRFVSGFIVNDADGIVLHKEGFKVPMEKHTSDVQSFTKRTFLRSRNYENVTEIRIKIFKSQYVPAIKKIEVWGEISPVCNRETKIKVRKLWSQIQPTFVTKLVPIISDNKTKTNKKYSMSCSDLIPEEFYDEITNEVMTLPMVLPSGKVIDFQTLEKFQNEEAKWGRPPSDPFTGVSFSNRSKPVIATVLKAKIDAFLLENSNLDIVKTLPRRLGDSISSSSFVVSKIVDNKNICKRKLHLTIEEQLVNKTMKYKTDKNCFSTRQSLCDERLEQVLQGLPSFLNTPEPAQTNIVKCVCCPATEQLYTLPCDHVMCRVCVTRNEHYCRYCQKNFTFAEVKKIHVLGSRGCM